MVLLWKTTGYHNEDEKYRLWCILFFHSFGLFVVKLSAMKTEMQKYYLFKPIKILLVT